MSEASFILFQVVLPVFSVSVANTGGNFTARAL